MNSIEFEYFGKAILFFVIVLMIDNYIEKVSLRAAKKKYLNKRIEYYQNTELTSLNGVIGKNKRLLSYSKPDDASESESGEADTEAGSKSESESNENEDYVTRTMSFENENESIVTIDNESVKIVSMQKRYYYFGGFKTGRLLNRVITVGLPIACHMYIVLETDKGEFYGLQMALRRSSTDSDGKINHGIELFGPFENIDELDRNFASKPEGAKVYIEEKWKPHETTLADIIDYISKENNKYNLIYNNCKQFAREFRKQFPPRNPSFWNNLLDLVFSNLDNFFVIISGIMISQILNLNLRDCGLSALDQLLITKIMDCQMINERLILNIISQFNNANVFLFFSIFLQKKKTNVLSCFNKKFYLCQNKRRKNLL